LRTPNSLLIPVGYYLRAPSGALFHFKGYVVLQTAVFVDAGYLYAAGSTLLAGEKQPRLRVRLNVPPMLADLIACAHEIEPNARLLRVYWYDGLNRGGLLNPEQRAVAESANVKCRFGTINSSGEQKGVDSLIVTDLIELARGQAISDAVIVSGDEDIRVGVQVAQSFGIRVHLLGIKPCRGNQSPDLLAETDTWKEWTDQVVSKWLTIVPVDTAPEPIQPTGGDWEIDIVSRRLKDFNPAQAADIVAYLQENRNALPADFDGPLLGSARTLLKRDLMEDEKRSLRDRARNAIREIASKA